MVTALEQTTEELKTVAGSKVVKIIERRGDYVLADVQYRWGIITRLLPRTYIIGLDGGE